MIKATNRKIVSSPTDYFNDVSISTYASSIDFFYGLVTDYPADDIIPGSINFIILGHHNKSSKELQDIFIGYPANPNFYNKPVPGEIVRIMSIQGFFTYVGKYQQDDNENGNMLEEYYKPEEVGIQTKPNGSDYQSYFRGTSQPVIQDTLNINSKTFITKDTKIPAILEKAGDTIIKGQANNDIILSYDQDNEPTIDIIINRRNTSYTPNTPGIHLHGNQDTIDTAINYTISNTSNIPTDDPRGNAIIISADKMRLNAINGSTFVSSKKHIGLSADKKITINSEEQVQVTSPSIHLGKDATESLLLGNSTLQ